MVSRGHIHDLAQRIATDFHPHRIILFGSHAGGRQREDSDVDLLVLVPLKQSPFRAALDIIERMDPPFALDLIVRDPADAENRHRLGDPLIREAFDHGQVLYEAAA